LCWQRDHRFDANGGLENVKTKLDELGFQKQTTRDPFPETRPMRVGSFEYGGNVFQLHIHVIEKNSPEAVELIEFRDSLWADADLREQYVLLKKSILSQGITNPIDYCTAKEQFIKKVTHLHFAFSDTSILKKQDNQQFYNFQKNRLFHTLLCHMTHFIFLRILSICFQTTIICA
jgi:GrpB protein